MTVSPLLHIRDLTVTIRGPGGEVPVAVSYTHLTLPTTPYV